MISAAEYQRRLKSVNKLSVLQDLAYEVIIKEESTLKDLKEQDFLTGDIYGDDSLHSYRSKNYELFKAYHNPLAGGAVDLILTGKFVNAMFLKKLQQNRYTFGNNDSKSAELSGKYGKEIFGLNKIVFDKFQREILAPRYIRMIKETAKIE